MDNERTNIRVYLCGYHFSWLQRISKNNIRESNALQKLSPSFDVVFCQFMWCVNKAEYLVGIHIPENEEK